MNKDNRLKISLTTDSYGLIFIGSLKIDGIVKHIKLSDNKKDELKKYICNVFHEINERQVFTEDKYKYSDIIDYKTYKSRITQPYDYTLTELLEVYVILSNEYNNTDWTNFCCNNLTGDFNVFCNNCNDCKNCVNCNNCDNCNDCDYCNNCDNCNDCIFCNNCNDCIECTKNNDCKTCNDCRYVNYENNLYKIDRYKRSFVTNRYKISN